MERGGHRGTQGRARARLQREGTIRFRFGEPLPAALVRKIVKAPLDSGEHDYFEIYGPANRDERLFPAATDGPIAAFAVDDLLEARGELEAANTEIIDDVFWASGVFADPSLEGFGWLFFRAPDGNVYVLQQERPLR